MARHLVRAARHPALNRMNFALALAGGRVPGTQVDLDRLIGPVDRRRPEQVMERLVDRILGGAISAETRRTLMAQLNDPEITRATADDRETNTDVAKVAALILGSPEFQRRLDCRRGAEAQGRRRAGSWWRGGQRPEDAAMDMMRRVFMRAGGGRGHRPGRRAALHQDLGDRMKDVVILTMSEFGRTVRENGNRGTDHGHANAMFVLGDPVKGGKVYGRHFLA